MTEKMTLEEELINIISEALGVEKEKISPNSDFYTDLNASKLEVADLILVCQKKLNIDLNEEVVNEVKTIKDLIKLFEQNSDEI